MENGLQDLVPLISSPLLTNIYTKSMSELIRPLKIIWPCVFR